MINYKKYPIAFDIGFHDIHALQLEKSRGKFKIHSMFHQKLKRALIDTEHSSQDLLESLKVIKKKGGFKDNRAVIHFPAHKVFSFPIECTQRKNEVIEEAIIKEVAKHLPYPLEDAVIDYPSITPSSKENFQKVIIVSVQRSDIERILLIFKKAGFQVDAVDFRPISSIRLHQYLFEVSDTPSVICYIGSKESSVQIFDNERILAMNKFTWGVNQIISTLNVNLGFDEKKSNAMSLLLKHGINSTSEKKKSSDKTLDETSDNKTGRVIARIIAPTLDQLILEFHKILGYIRNKDGVYKISGISFYGSAPKLKGLDQYIQSRLNIPAKTVSIQDYIEMKKDFSKAGSNDITPFAAAIGLAMREIPWL